MYDLGHQLSCMGTQAGIEDVSPISRERRKGPPRRKESSLTNACALAAINRQQHSSDELRFVRSKEQRGVSYVPGRSHLPAQRNRSVSLTDQVFLRNSSRL